MIFLYSFQEASYSLLVFTDTFVSFKLLGHKSQVVEILALQPESAIEPCFSSVPGETGRFQGTINGSRWTLNVLYTLSPKSKIHVVYQFVFVPFSS